MGVLLRADLTGHGHPSCFWQKGLGWPCPVWSALKRMPVQDINSFSIMFYYIISPTYKKMITICITHYICNNSVNYLTLISIKPGYMYTLVIWVHSVTDGDDVYRLEGELRNFGVSKELFLWT